MSRKKITLIGGGQIGGNLALLAAQKELGDVVIFDIPNAEGMVKGKALDLMQLRPHEGYDSNVYGTSNWNDTSDTDVFIITAGIPRKPGMDREDLLGINLGIMKDVANNIKEQAPNSFVIVISNPLVPLFEDDIKKWFWPGLCQDVPKIEIYLRAFNGENMVSSKRVQLNEYWKPFVPSAQRCRCFHRA